MSHSSTAGMTTFNKRKDTVMKKSEELHNITGAHVLTLIASPTGEVFTYASGKFEALLEDADIKQKVLLQLNQPESTAGPSRTEPRAANSKSLKQPSVAEYSEDQQILPQSGYQLTSQVGVMSEMVASHTDSVHGVVKSSMKVRRGHKRPASRLLEESPVEKRRCDSPMKFISPPGTMLAPGAALPLTAGTQALPAREDPVEPGGPLMEATIQSFQAIDQDLETMISIYLGGDIPNGNDPSFDCYFNDHNNESEADIQHSNKEKSSDNAD